MFSDHTKREPNLPLLDKFRTLKSASEKLCLGCKWPFSRIHGKQNLSIDHLLSDTLGFLGHAKQKTADLSPECFNRSRLIEAYLDFLKVGYF